MGKGKAPAFQFYVKDWLSDPELRMADASTRGIWIDLLCFMKWDTKQNGTLRASFNRFVAMMGIRTSQFELFIKEAKELKFCDIFDDVTESNRIITIINRRLLREAQDRKNTRERVQKYRRNKASNENVTDEYTPSPSPSPSPSPKNQKSGHFSNKVKEYLDQINNLGLQYENLGFKKVWQLIQEWANKEIHPEAMFETLDGALPFYRKGEVKDPQAYLRQIMKIKAQNWREKDFIKDHEERNAFFKNLVTQIKREIPS